MHTFQELLRAVTQEFATRYYIAILLRFLKILPLQPGHMGDRCSPHARDALRRVCLRRACCYVCLNGKREWVCTQTPQLEYGGLCAGVAAAAVMQYADGRSQGRRGCGFNIQQ